MRTKQSLFLHIPKTGGKWVNDVCRSISVPIDDMPVYYDDVDHRIHVCPELRVFSFVRNPWAWYVSAYEHLRRDVSDHTFKQFTSGADITFEESIEIAMNMPLWTKVKLWQLRRAMLPVIQQDQLKEKQNRQAGQYSAITHDADVWADLVKEQELDLYSFFIKHYTANAQQVGRTETIAEDLIRMLSSTGELLSDVEQRIATTPPVNTGNITDYRSYYNNHTHDLVAAHCAIMIKTFDYKF